MLVPYCSEVEYYCTIADLSWDCSFKSLTIICNHSFLNVCLFVCLFANVSMPPPPHRQTETQAYTHTDTHIQSALISTTCHTGRHGNPRVPVAAAVCVCGG